MKWYDDSIFDITQKFKSFEDLGLNEESIFFTQKYIQFIFPKVIKSKELVCQLLLLRNV